MPTDQIIGAADDGASQVAGPRRQRTLGEKIAIAAALGVIAPAAIGVHWLLSGSPAPKEYAPPANQLGLTGQPFWRPTTARPPAPTLPQVRSLPPIAWPKTQTPPQKQAFDPGAAGPFLSVAAGAAPVPAAGGHHTADDPQSDSVHDGFSRALTPSDVGGTTYARLMRDPEYTVPAGTLIHCILDTAIDSQLMGFVRCHIDGKDRVMNATGDAVMMDAGTWIMGQIRSGPLNGADRLFVLWTFARTPQNAVVQLNSPAADPLGRSGVPGTLDTHFWHNFFNTAIYSLVGGAPQIASSALQNGSGNQYLSLMAPQQNLAGQALQYQMKAPNITVNQGDEITVFLGHDIDFSKVYRFRLVNGFKTLTGE
jgi:type IV secretion system protein VirB10